MSYKKIFTCLFVLFLTSAAFSQKLYFIYLQSENKQAFFVKLNEKTYNSNASGYIIIARLLDTTHNISIGIVGENKSLSNFSVVMNRKDHGFLLKKFDNNWGLFDLQSLEIIKVTTASTQQAANNTASAKDIPAFTEGLAKAADDPSLKERPLVPTATEKKPEVIVEKKEVPPTIPETQPTTTTPPAQEKKEVTTTEPDKKKEEPEQAETIKEKSTIKIEPLEESPSQKKIEVPPVEVSNNQESNSITETPAYKPSVVKKRSESSNTQGFGLIFIDTYANGVSDTIKLLIPNPKTPQAVITAPEKASEADKKKEQPQQADTIKENSTIKIEPLEEIASQKKNEVTPPEVGLNQETKSSIENPAYKASVVKRKAERSTTEGFGLTFIDLKTNGTTDTIQLVISNPKTPQAVVTIPEKATEPDKVVRCMVVANDADFLELRKQMAATSDDAGMINEAKKSFSKFCYNTTQIKNLSVLFLTDEGKYRFFDAAYDYTRDIANFPSLESEIKDEYYSKQFKALVRN